MWINKLGSHWMWMPLSSLLIGLQDTMMWHIVAVSVQAHSSSADDRPHFFRRDAQRPWPVLNWFKVHRCARSTLNPGTQTGCWLSDTHTHPFNGPLSRTTQVIQYQKSKTNLDFTEARDISLQTDNHGSTPPLKVIYRPDALSVAQLTASQHWRQCVAMSSGWPLCWKTWKCRRIWQLSGVCQGID